MRRSMMEEYQRTPMLHLNSSLYLVLYTDYTDRQRSKPPPPNCLSGQLSNPRRKLVAVTTPGFKYRNEHLVFTQGFPFAG